MLLDKIINTVFSLGAAIVIFGAWGKLENKEFGSTALTAGLLTETAIFCLYGILEWRRRPAKRAGTMEEQGRPAETPGPEAVDAQRPELVDVRGPRTGERSRMEPQAGLPVHKEDLEALTGSIKETANLLARIFRV